MTLKEPSLFFKFFAVNETSLVSFEWGWLCIKYRHGLITDENEGIRVFKACSHPSLHSHDQPPRVREKREREEKVKALRGEEKRGCSWSKVMVNQTSSIRFYPFSLDFHKKLKGE